MKSKALLLLLIPFLSMWASAQCDYNVKPLVFEGYNDTMQMIDKSLVLPSKSGTDLQFNICKSKTTLFIKGRALRNLSSKFLITSKNPLVFIYDNNKEIVLYPINLDSNRIMNSHFELTLWTRYHTVLYEISQEQLKYLSQNIPSDIRLHYSSEKESKYSDKFGGYWSLNLQLNMYYKRFMKVAKCALEQL